MNVPTLEVRSCARLILLDAAGRVLLFRTIDGHGREYWFTPGGGLEPGKTPEQAGRREAAEELGLEHVELILLWNGHSRFLFANRRVSQAESFFLVASHSGEVGLKVGAVHWREGILEMRWWDVAEIERSKESVFPKDLAAQVQRHLRPTN